MWNKNFVEDIAGYISVVLNIKLRISIQLIHLIEMERVVTQWPQGVFNLCYSGSFRVNRIFI